MQKYVFCIYLSLYSGEKSRFLILIIVFFSMGIADLKKTSTFATAIGKPLLLIKQ